MSGTINLTANITIANGSLNDRFAPGPQTITQTNNGKGGTSQSIPTTSTGTAITGLSGLTNMGYGGFQNLDATNFITIGLVVSATYYPVLKLKAGEYNVLRLVPGVTYYAKADTNSVILLTQIWED